MYFQNPHSLLFIENKQTNSDILKTVTFCNDLTTAIKSQPDEKIKNTSYTVAMGVSFKELANTLFPIFGLHIQWRYGPGRDQSTLKRNWVCMTSNRQSQSGKIWECRIIQSLLHYYSRGWLIHCIPHQGFLFGNGARGETRLMLVQHQ